MNPSAIIGLCLINFLKTTKEIRFTILLPGGFDSTNALASSIMMWLERKRTVTEVASRASMVLPQLGRTGCLVQNTLNV